MGLPQYTDITLFSSAEIDEAITDIKIELFNLRFKKATKRSFKSHEIKYAKRRLAQLKTLIRLNIDITILQDIIDDRSVD